MEGNNTLLKILLVDDEPFIRQGLAALIDWEAEGYCITGEASNGKNAIEVLKESEFDLIISDIKMPEMDGIEFISIVVKNKISRAKFVFLSGFYDFQYAKTAIRYGCSDYILKPIQKEELLSTLRKILEEHRKEAGREKDNQVYEKAYLDRNLLAMIWGKYDEVNVKYINERMQLSKEIAYIHLEIYLRDEKFAVLPDYKKREQQHKLCNYAGLILKKQADHIIFDVLKHTECYDMGLIYCTHMAEEKGMTEKDWLNWFLGELSERMGYEIVACVGNKVTGIENIAESYREAAMTRFLRFFEKCENKTAGSAKKEFGMKNNQEKYYKKEMDCLIHAIEISDKPGIRENAKLFFRRIMDRCSDSEIIGLNIQYLLYRLLGLAYEQEPNIDQEEVMQYIRDGIFNTGNRQGSEVKFKQFAEEYADYLMQLRQSAVKGSINQIEAEIEEKYAENLSLKSLGEKYYINSAYLGQIFKKQYGCCFKDYLNTVRIRKAAEMLLRTDDKVYEVAVNVGYKNLEYFINKFESVYGVTPTRFRKRNARL